MIAFHAFGVRFTLPLLTLLAPLLASRLGLKGSALAVLPALAAHELAHLAAAKLARINITEIRLMPFGGSARIENPYALPACRLIPASAAGPAANLLLAVACAALVHWRLLAPAKAAAFIRINLLLFLFNLLPALPLDGGRMLYALLEGPLGAANALRAVLWPGRILAALLLAAAVYSGLRGRKWNLTLVLAAVFILASERDERSALTEARTRRFSSMLDDRDEMHPARLYRAEASLPARRVLSSLHSREYAWFILTRNGAPSAMTDSRSLLRHLIENDAPDALLEDVPAYRLLPSRTSGA